MIYAIIKEIKCDSMDCVTITSIRISSARSLTRVQNRKYASSHVCIRWGMVKEVRIIVKIGKCVSKENQNLSEQKGAFRLSCIYTFDLLTRIIPISDIMDSLIEKGFRLGKRTNWLMWESCSQHRMYEVLFSFDVNWIC